MRFAIPPRQLMLGGWRLGARGSVCCLNIPCVIFPAVTFLAVMYPAVIFPAVIFPAVIYLTVVFHGDLCGVLGDSLVYLGVLCGSLGVPWDYLGCPWSFWEFPEGPWGSLRSRGFPKELWKSLKNIFVLFYFHKCPKPLYS